MMRPVVFDPPETDGKLAHRYIVDHLVQWSDPRLTRAGA
jgi:hypothetical protein